MLTDLGLVMDPAAMLQVEEQRPGVIDVEVRGPDGEPVVLGEGSRVVQVLAAQQWLATPLPLALEMLAAHVHAQPPGGHRAGRRGGRRCSRSRPAAAPSRATPTAPSGSTRSSPRSPTPCTRRGIRYSEPPASWSDLGQQVRTPGDVLTWRVGTPLDTVVVLAAALEQAGIRPLLWLAEGSGGRVGGRRTRSSATGARSAAPRAPPPPTPRRWSTWSTSG